MPVLKKSPRGDGQPILVLPGFMTGDNATFILRRFLTNQGFEAHPWDQGRNPGLREEIFDNLCIKIDELYTKYGQKVSLVGWSLGGVYARALAHKMPNKVRQVVTLGSPFALSAKFDPDELGVSSSVMKLYEKLNPNIKEDKFVNGEPVWENPPSVPCSSIYTKGDGIASWRYCIDTLHDTLDKTENIRVRGSHTGLTHNPCVLYALADRLSQREEAWEAFEAKWYHRLFFSTALCS
jgi:pimeloyl-ACP methyl ester carboxylesterase